MKNYLLLILTLLFTSYSFTQVSTVKGRVLDSNGFALPGATIQASPQAKPWLQTSMGSIQLLGLKETKQLRYLTLL